MVIWLTGPSGAGKTTLAQALQQEISSIILDGNEMRESISLGAGFSRQDRTRHNLRVARLAGMLARQTTVIVSVIAPIEQVRQEITRICNPFWVYLKKNLLCREGHFYEVPDGYFTIDTDRLSVVDSVKAILPHVKTPRIYSLLIGRYQPLHAGHIRLIEHLKDEGNSVLVAIRDTPLNEENPYTIAERKAMFRQAFPTDPNPKVIVLDDIEAVCYGREVGWDIRQIHLDVETEAISATHIRGKRSEC